MTDGKACGRACIRGNVHGDVLITAAYLHIVGRGDQTVAVADVDAEGLRIGGREVPDPERKLSFAFWKRELGADSPVVGSERGAVQIGIGTDGVGTAVSVVAILDPGPVVAVAVRVGEYPAVLCCVGLKIPGSDGGEFLRFGGSFSLCERRGDEPEQQAERDQKTEDLLHVVFSFACFFLHDDMIFHAYIILYCMRSVIARQAPLNQTKRKTCAPLKNRARDDIIKAAEYRRKEPLPLKGTGLKQWKTK